MRKALALALCCASVSYLVGCSTTRTTFMEGIPLGEGGESWTMYDARTRAAPFAKVDISAHKFTYRYGGEENEITVGQDFGADNTPQIEALKIAVESLLEIVKLQAGVGVTNGTSETSLSPKWLNLEVGCRDSLYGSPVPLECSVRRTHVPSEGEHILYPTAWREDKGQRDLVRLHPGAIEGDKGYCEE